MALPRRSDAWFYTGDGHRSFRLHWTSSDFDLLLVNPDGEVIDRNRAEHDDQIELVEGSTYEVYRVQNPVPGNWQVRVIPVGTPVAGEPYRLSVSTDSPIVAELKTDHLAYDAGETIQIQVQVSEQDAPLLNAAAVVTITPPHGASYATAQATLFDDGEHSDGAAGDGIYGGEFMGTDLPGLYEIQMQTIGEAEAGFEFKRLSKLTVFVADTATSTAAPSELRDDFEYVVEATQVASPFATFDVLFDWHNASDPSDVDGNGHRSSTDVLAVINYIQAHDSGPLPVQRHSSGRIDVNNDGFASPMDALVAINRLNNSHSSVLAEGEPLVMAPSDLTSETRVLSQQTSDNHVADLLGSESDQQRPYPGAAETSGPAASQQGRRQRVAIESDLESALSDFTRDIAEVWWGERA